MKQGLIALLWLLSTATAHAFPTAICDSGNSSELVTSIPVTNGVPYNFVPIFRCSIPDVKAGDLIRINAYGQVSNNIGPNKDNNNVMFGYYVKAGAPGAEMLEAAEGRTTNVDRVRHHEDWQVSTFYIATRDWPILSFVVYGYSASSAAKSDWVLTVDKDYGRLQLEHYAQPVPSSSGLL